jgi:hypothetical protein
MQWHIDQAASAGATMREVLGAKVISRAFSKNVRLRELCQRRDLSPLTRRAERLAARLAAV